MLLFSCSKKDDDFVKWNDIYTSWGSITVKLTGASADTVQLNETLVGDKFSTMSPSQEATYSKSGTAYYFHIYRNFDKAGYNSVTLSFTKVGDAISNAVLDLSYEKILTNGKVLNLNESPTLVITNCTFDASTGMVKGSYAGKVVNGINTLNFSGDFNVKTFQTLN